MAHLGRLVRARGALDRPGQRARVQRRQRRRGRPGRLAGGAPLPGPPPRHGAADRPQARGEVRLRRPAAGARRPARAGLPRPRHRHQAGAARARLLGRVPGLRRPEGPDAGRGRRRDLPRARHHDEQADGRQQRGQRRALAVRHRSAPTRWAGRDPTACRRSTRPGRRRPGCWPRCRSTSGCRGGWWPDQDVTLPQARRVGAPLPDPVRPARRPPVAGHSSTARRRRRCCGPAARRWGCPRTRRSPATTACSRGR